MAKGSGSTRSAGSGGAKATGRRNAVSSEVSRLANETPKVQSAVREINSILTRYKNLTLNRQTYGGEIIWNCLKNLPVGTKIEAETGAGEVITFTKYNQSKWSHIWQDWGKQSSKDGFTAGKIADIICSKRVKKVWANTDRLV